MVTERGPNARHPLLSECPLGRCFLRDEAEAGGKGGVRAEAVGEVFPTDNGVAVGGSDEAVDPRADDWFEVVRGVGFQVVVGDGVDERRVDDIGDVVVAVGEIPPECFQSAVEGAQVEVFGGCVGIGVGGLANCLRGDLSGGRVKVVRTGVRFDFADDVFLVVSASCHVYATSSLSGIK
ncbi:hypothetical protein [Natronobacterium gregoryi]|uniref:hypothetical protein n=1 Tax=Natronobacterium gregoryi TaxID=44930 RepID=UPI001E5A1DEA|nr:hypothetical protein [Natronobacterium gregoryi]